MRRYAPLLLLLGATPLAAQSKSAAPATATPLGRAAATITTADVARRIGIIADDSMLGRDTPSRGLDLTAQYVADEFKRFGLKPGGDDGTWFQRYPITRRKLLVGSSAVVVSDGRNPLRLPLGQSARFVRGSVPAAAIEGELILLGGALDPATADKLPVKDKVVLFVTDYADAERQDRLSQVARALRAAGPKAIVMVANLDAATFKQKSAAQGRERTVIDLGDPTVPVLEVREDALLPLAKPHGVDFDAIRASSTPVVRPFDGGGSVRIDLKEQVVSSQTAPNTIGVLEGSDPKLKGEYLVYSAHMDHVGVGTPVNGDSIFNGADDDASGTAAVIELAEAFSQPGARPKRSVIFMTVSGEEKGLWGSQYYSEHPTVPVKDIVANINIDMIGRNWPDTIVAIGKEHSDLGATLNRVNAQHPELRMTAIDDMWPEERFYFRSDHYNFARKGVPVLFFFNGVHVDYHKQSDSPDKIDAEKEARIVKLLFHLGQDVANTAARPKWNPESYKEIVEGTGGR